MSIYISMSKGMTMSCLFKYSTAENSSWKTELLSNIAETTSGGTPDKKHPEYYDNGNILWVRSGELDKGIINDTEIKITNKGLHNSSAKVFPAGGHFVAINARREYRRIIMLHFNLSSISKGFGQDCSRPPLQ